MNVVLIIISVAVIIATLLQPGKENGGIQGMTGGSLSLFNNRKARGSERVLELVTLGLTIGYFLMVLIIRKVG